MSTAPARGAFDRRLHAIDARVADVFRMVAQDLPPATQALLDGRGETADELAGREQAIDALYPEIEKFACREILLQAPVAADLRFLLSVLRVVPELERSHDLIMQIASSAGQIPAGSLSTRARTLTGQMGDLAASMWRQAAISWRMRDGSAASTLATRGEDMAQLHSSVTAELASGTMPLAVAMEMTLAARCYDRLAAHAVNIARRVVYLASPATR